MQLVLEKVKFYKMKRGQTAKEVENTLGYPVNDGFSGAVVASEECFSYTVQPFENYQTIAKKFNVNEEELKNFNGERLLYPSRTLFIPGQIHSQKSQSI